MKKRLTMFVVLIAIIVTGSVLWTRLTRQNAQPAGTLAGNGVIEATEVDVSAEVAGKVLMLVPQEGDEVKKGQLIAVLGTGGLQGQVEQAQAALQTAQANLAALQAGTRPEDLQRIHAQTVAAEKALKQAQAGCALVYAGPRQEEIAQLQSAYEQAVAQRDLLLAGTRPEQIKGLRSAVEQAQAQLDLVKAGPRQEDIEQRRAAYSSAQATLTNAETELHRMERLHEQGAVANQKVDLARTTRDVASEQARAMKAQLDAALVGARPQEIKAVEANLAQARQRLADAEAGARPQELAQATSAVNIARQRLQQAKHGARPLERAQADAAVAQAQAQVEAARAAYNLAVAGPRAEDIAAARARVEQAKGAVNSATTVREQTRIYAPTTARVTSRNLEPGDLATPGTPIVQLAELKQVWLRVYVPETQVGKVMLEKRATVTTDSSQGKVFEGKVTEIAQEPEYTPKNIQTKEERVKLVFGVKITIDNPMQELKPGMPADALIYVGR